ncbi:hypothetical protein LTR09_004503 [Extremus antarcticus]|uniref:BTB domain-containing protein n=1 Tax=Extremus antarcticus TaxID=702011 RepID=A0AAJ0DQL4_9PEZI|nr:hypothetical protein LTR09_004503 [Extremus antarcticus]
MSSLSVPQQGQPQLRSSGSQSSLRRNTIEHTDDLAPMSRSRHNSASSAGNAPFPSSAPSAGAPQSAAARAGLVPLPEGPIQSTAENYALTAPVDWQESDQLTSAGAHAGKTTLYIGRNKKPIHVCTEKLKEKSPYFQHLLGDNNPHPSAEQTTFDDLDEFGMGLFMLWLKMNVQLHGPHDFHSLAHYLSLYVVACKFEIEELENQVMDLVRHYYSSQNMTAPAYRLEYVYHFTSTPNKMRDFLVSTAAFRALEDSHGPDNLAHAGPLMHKSFYQPGSYVSDSIKGVLKKNPEMAIDFIETLHSHEKTQKCKEAGPQEAWQSDGAGDEKPAAKADPPKAAEPKKEDPKPAAPAPAAGAAPADRKSSTQRSPPTTTASVVEDKHNPNPPWRSETQRLQWEMTERALAKSDAGPMKKFGDKMKGMKDKLHSKKDDKKDKTADKASEKADKAAEKTQDKADKATDKAEKVADKTADKAAEKRADKPADKPRDDKAAAPAKK